LKKLAIVVTVVGATLAVVISLTGARDVAPKPGSAQASTTAHEITALLNGIPQHANTLGQPGAPITLRWYGDLECPYCRQFTLGALPTIITRWVRGGRLKIEYLSLETATRDPTTFRIQQVAALAAGRLNKMWNYIEIFYHEQGQEDSGYITNAYLSGLARQIPGLDLALWAEYRYDPNLAAEVAAEERAATHAHYVETPTFLIGHSGGTLHKLIWSSLTEPGIFNGAISYLLNSAEQ
jgi:protein-disulfide isomerase